MRKRISQQAIVTVQAAHISGLDFYGRPNPYVRILVMVPKGKHNVTVPTNCTTFVREDTLRPVWNQTFSIPVRRLSDVLVFQMFDQPQSQAVARFRRGALSAIIPGQDQAGHIEPDSIAQKRLSGQDESAPDAAGGSSTSSPSMNFPESNQDGKNIGACMFPVDLLPQSGEVIRRKLELFVNAADGPGAGLLYIAAKLEESEVDLLEKSDLNTELIGQFHDSRLQAFQDRFIGIGELAAFLYEEGYSENIDATWDRAVTILAEQLAYRIFETTGSTADRSNFASAKAQVEKDGGLWDAI